MLDREIQSLDTTVFHKNLLLTVSHLAMSADSPRAAAKAYTLLEGSTRAIGTHLRPLARDVMIWVMMQFFGTTRFMLSEGIARAFAHEWNRNIHSNLLMSATICLRGRRGRLVELPRWRLAWFEQGRTV